MISIIYIEKEVLFLPLIARTILPVSAFIIYILLLLNILQKIISELSRFKETNVIFTSKSKFIILYINLDII